MLTAGVSLPVFSPAVERGGRKLVDAVWIKDTNVTEALRRGAEELWLVWCIGNHGVYVTDVVGGSIAGLPQEEADVRLVAPRPLPA